MLLVFWQPCKGSMPHAGLPGELLVCLVQQTGVGSSLSPSSGCSDGERRAPRQPFCCRNSRPVVPGMTVENSSNPEMCVPISFILNGEYKGEEQRLKVFTLMLHKMVCGLFQIYSSAEPKGALTVCSGCLVLPRQARRESSPTIF